MNVVEKKTKNAFAFLPTWLIAISALVVPAFAGPGGRGGKDELPKFDDVTKDMEVKEGFFTLYYDKKKDKLLGKIPSSLLGKPFLVSLSIPKGPTFAGWMVGGGAMYWERLENKLVLMESDTRVKKGKGSTVEDVIGRTYTDAIVTDVDVVTETPGGDPVIAFDELLKKDLIGLGQAYGGRRMDASLSRWSTSKAFPDNVELAVDGAFMSKDPTEGGIIAAVHASFSRLPENGYKTREADDRIGYFLTVQKDWTVDHSEKTVFKRYVNRWDLEKQDPKAESSPVKEPIIFYIEKTVPVRYRRAVRDGILAWSTAFEKCGFLDAIQVRQQTDTNEFKDLDPEDVRYNFFRWIVSGRAFARGPSRVNPFTGQILDADIIMDDSMVRFYVWEQSLLGPKAYDMFDDPVAEEFLSRNPAFQPTSWEESLTPTFASAQVSVGPADQTIQSPLKALRLTESPCEYAKGMVHQLAFGQLQSASMGQGTLPHEFIEQIIAEIVAHEVGHTLGLRHNFKGSSWRKLSDILSTSAEHRALTASVMDYNPAEYPSEKQDDWQYVTPTIGPYDYWAIEYGYKPFTAGGDAKSEEDMLTSIARLSAEDGHAYATDEDTSDFGPDPFVYRYDNGDDPLAYARHRMEMVDRLKKDLTDWAVEDGESYQRLRRAVTILLNEYSFASRVAARLVGGQNVTRAHKGDPDAPPPFTVVSAERQRAAIHFLETTVFSDPAFQWTPDVLNRLAPGRFGHWDSDQWDSIDFNLHDRVRAIQARALTLLINPITVNRLYDAELKVPASEDAFTVPELFTMVTDTIWKELDDAPASPRTNRQPQISSFRRTLQREYLRRVVATLLAEPGSGLNADSYAVLRLTVKTLRDRIEKRLKESGGDLDAYTLAHLTDARERIDKVLQAQYTNESDNSNGRSARRG